MLFQRSQSSQRLNHTCNNFYKLVTFARRYVIKAKSVPGDTKLSQQSYKYPVALDCLVITFFVMAVAGMTGKYYNTIRAFCKCLHNELRVDPAAAHDFDNANVRRIGIMGRSSLICSGI